MYGLKASLDWETMNRLLPMMAATLLALGCFQGGSAWGQETPASSIHCAATAGHLQGPFVPTEVVARQLFEVYLKQFSPGHRDSRLHRVIVVDAGDLWRIREDNRVRDAQGRPESLIGGAGVAITIDKCSGAVLSATNMR